MAGRFLAAGLVALVAARAAAEGPPAPPQDYPPVAVAAGAAWTAPAGGGVCLDRPAFRYQVELRRWDEARLREAMRLAEERPVKVVAVSAGVGLAVGIVVGVLAAGRR